MFDHIRKVFSRWPLSRAQGAQTPALDSEPAYAPVSQWAATQGFEFWAPGLRQSFAVTGKIGDKTWQLELGPPSRCYVTGEELRARADLGVAGDITVVVLSRQLKETLQAQSRVRTISGPAVLPQGGLGEELNWLAELAEVQWDGPPPLLWSHFAVLAHRRDDGVAWLDPDLVRQLLAWPLPGATTEVPFLLLLSRGKVLLRMEYRPADLPTLQHAAGLFTNACESALARFSSAADCSQPPIQRH